MTKVVLTQQEIEAADEHFGLTDDSNESMSYNSYLDEIIEDMEEFGSDEDMQYLGDGVYMLSDGTFIYTDD